MVCSRHEKAGTESRAIEGRLGKREEGGDDDEEESIERGRMMTSDDEDVKSGRRAAMK